MKVEQGSRLSKPPVQRRKVLLLVLAVGILGGLYFYNLDGWLIDDDEGSFLYQAWRTSEGESPYADFFSTRWPFFLYTAGALVRLSGRTIWLIRAAPVLLTLLTALVLFLLARRFLPAAGAWLAVLTFLLHPDLFFHGRLLYAEAFMLFFDVLGLYLFCRGWDEQRGALLALAGISFGTAVFFQPMGILPFAGCLLWMLTELWRQRGDWPSWARRSLAFLVPFGLFIALVFLCLAYWAPAFYSTAVSSHLSEGQGTSKTPALLNGTILLLRYVVENLPLMVFVLPAAWIVARKNRPEALVAWQLPAALAFLVLSRPLFPRHLYFLIPSLAILFAVALEPLRRWPKRTFLFAAVVVAVLFPWAIKDIEVALRTEDDTARIVQLVSEQIDTDAYLISDYQELNFHAARRSVYSGAEISLAMIEGGRITATDLIEEIESNPVRMVIVDVSPETAYHIWTLPDYERFQAYLEEHFELLGQFPRAQQLLEIHVRNGAP